MDVRRPNIAAHIAALLRNLRRGCVVFQLCLCIFAFGTLSAAEGRVSGQKVTENAAPYSESWDQMRERSDAKAASGQMTERHTSPRQRLTKPGSATAPDTAITASVRSYSAASRAPQTQGTGFAGINLSNEQASGFGTYIPPDTMGAVGINHFVELINGSITLYDKSNTNLISRTDIDSFFTVVDTGTTYPRNGAFDPRILFDRRSGHWFACALEFGPTTSGNDNNIILAVSRTSDPSKVWDKYLIPVGVPDGSGNTTFFTDFDTLGVDDNGVYFGMHIFPSKTSTPDYAKLAATQKAPLLASSPSRGPVFTFANITDMYSSPQPAHNQDPIGATDPEYFVSASTTVFANVNYRKLTWSNGVPTLDSTASVLTTPTYAAPINAPCKGSSTPADVGDDRSCSTVIRAGHLWTCRNIGVNNAGNTQTTADRTACEWFDIALPGFTLSQSGRVYDSSATPLFYYMPSVMVSGQGHMALGFSGSNANQYISAYSCGRLASDGLGTTEGIALLVAGANSYKRLDQTINRFGDFSYTSLDPNDDMTMWTIQEYATSTANIWGTWISQLKAPAPTLVSVSPAGPSGIQGQSGITLTLTGTGLYDPGPGYKNRLAITLSGSNIFNYSVTYTNPTTASVTFDIGVTAATGLRNIVLTNPDGQTATLANAFTVNAGPANLTIGDSIWNDADGDGTLNGAETGIAGVTVKLYEDSNKNNVFDVALDTLVASTTTSGGGNYSFTNLNPGRYIVLVPSANFKTGSPLHFLHSSVSGYNVIPGIGVVSPAIALSSSNSNVDFGFAPQTLQINSITPNAPSVQKYAKLELTVALANVAGTQFYDWDQSQGGLNLSATFTSPTSVVWNVNGFFDGSAWKIRFAPNEIGSWNYTVSAQDANGTVTSASNTFTSTESTYPGWLRINGTTLQFSEGLPFFAIGHNTGYQPDVDYPAFPSMAAKGENLLSFWLAMPWAQPSWASASEPFWDKRSPIENSEGGVGNYNQVACNYIDSVVNNAEANGIYLLPSIWAHDQLTDSAAGPSGWPSSWNNNAYKTVCSAAAFYTQNTEQWRLQQNFYRYLIARWGYSRAIAGWVGVVEINGTTAYAGTGGNSTTGDQWCAAVRNYFAANDPFHVNGSGKYPLFFSKTDGGTNVNYDPVDARALDSYSSKTDDINIASTVATQTGTMRSNGKPALITEFGGQLPTASQPLHLHNGIWAGTASGGCGTPLLWCDDFLYPNFFPMVSPVMQDHYQILSQFMRGVNYLGNAGITAISTGSTIVIAGTNSADFRGWGMRTNDRGFVWIQRNASAGGFAGQTVKISGGLIDGQYVIEWYDAWTSGAVPISTQLLTISGGGGNGNFTATSPTLVQQDIAMKFVRTAVWTGANAANHTDWNIPANWSDNAVPGTGSFPLIPTNPSGGAFFPVISAAPPSAIDRLQIQTGATLTINSGLTLSVIGGGGTPLINGTGTVNGAGTLELAPSLDADGILFLNSMTVGNLRLNAAFGSRKFTLTNGVSVTATSVTNASGNLEVNGTFVTTSDTVNAGTLMTGIGTAGTVADNGTVNPGAGTGNLTATSANFSSGGTLAITAKNNAPNIAASGNSLTLTGASPLTLGGTSALSLTLNIESGTYSPAQDTVLVNCTGGTFTGTFATVTSNHGWPITGITLVYSASQVILRLSGNITPVTLSEFTAQSEGGGALLEWECASEFENAGFNLWRRHAGEQNSEWTKANPTLIAGRLTTAAAKKYRFFDWPEAGEYEYRLESVSTQGVRESYWPCEGTVTVTASQEDVISDAGLLAAIDTAIVETSIRRGETLAEKILNVESLPQARIAMQRVTDPPAPKHATALRSANVRAAGARATAGDDSFIKVLASGSGILYLPQADLSRDATMLSIEREGSAVTPLAQGSGGLLLYAPGYADLYTDKDAFFLRPGNVQTLIAPPAPAQGLFNDATVPVTSTAASAVQDYHDVYFDYSLRPVSYPPWFSSEYLTDGSTQNFSLATPAPTADAATLTIDLWSLTESPAISPDHILQAFVNGNAIGQAEWSGGDKALTLTFDIPAGILADGANSIDLRTPDLGYGQISFVHTIKIDYTRTLNAPGGVELTNSGAAQLYEISGLSSDQLWIAAIDDNGGAALVAYETQAQADGSFKCRFVAPDLSKCIVVPQGSEIRALSIRERTLKPLPTGIDYLAAGPSQFSDAIVPLIAARSREGLPAAFVDQEDLFDRFSFGRYGPEAIRSAVKALGVHYLLLVGRSTYDYRDYAPPTVDALCPSFLISTTFFAQTVSDPSFGDLGNGYPEIQVGRLPVNTPDELAVAVTRTLNYVGLPESGQRALISADRADPTAGNFPAEADSTINSAPEIAWTKAYLGITYPDAPPITEMLRTAASGSADMIVYAGHGNARLLGLDSPQILNVDTVQTWTGNIILIQATCNGNWFVRDILNYHSIAIQALTQPQGGIAASIGSSTYMNAQPHIEFVQTLLRQNTSSDARWGQALLKTQQWANGVSTVTPSGSWYKDLALTECLLGDPALPVFKRSAKTPNSGSAPGNSPVSNVGPAASAVRLNLQKLSGSMNFAQPGRDSVAAAGALSVPPDQAIKGMTMTIDIAGASATFTLSAAGRAKTGAGTFQIGKVSRGGVRMFRAALKGDFQQAWSAQGMSPNVQRVQGNVDVNIGLNGTSNQSTVPVEYSAHGTIGHFKK